VIRDVVLIYPSARRYSGFLSTHRVPGLVSAHAGLTIIKQVLERRGLRARVYDEQITPFTEELVDGADLVGISVQTSWAPQAYRIAAAARRAGRLVVLGGVHVTLNPDEALAHADYVVRGEGEHSLLELVEALEGRRTLDSVQGISYLQDGRAVHNPERPLLTTAELDQVPFPRIDLIEGWNDYRRFPMNRVVYSTMLTRGCDQACTYCSITRVFGRSLRHRSVSNVIEELGSLFNPRRQFLFLMDDSLAVNTDFLKQVLEAMLREKLVPRLGWHSQLRAEVARDRELLRLMQLTNCAFVTCGFESINPKSLRALGKGQSREDVVRAIAGLRAHDIVVNGFFMFGTDHDDVHAMGETVKFAQQSGCLFAGFMPLTPFPGTPTFTRLEREGRIFSKDWEIYDVQHVVFHPKRMSAWDLYWKTLACYPAFYARRRVLDQLRLMRSKRPPLSLLFIGGTWPLVKQACWTRELVANLDYMRELRRMNSTSNQFPDLGRSGLWLKDLVSGRAVRSARARLARRMR
jgi:radical SAM superfamily enzyme YgiQ (UPF0313 family)